MKKRILQFVGSFHQGGSERQAVSLTGLLKNEGSFDVYAATLNRSGVLLSDIEDMGLPAVPEFPLTSFYNAKFVDQVRTCAKYLTENKIDLVHTHDFYTNVFGMAAASLARVPVRITSKRETTGMRSGAQNIVEKAAFTRADRVVVNSNAVRSHLAERGMKGSKVRLIYNGIGLDRFSNVRSDSEELCRRYHLPVGGDARFITMVANLRHDVKNVPMLLRAAKRVTSVDLTAHFVIAGEGELKPGLEAMANKMGITANVHFIGRCSDVPELLSASYLCVLTSKAEGFSNSILEYMAAGKPVVATNVGGASEAMIYGATGYLVESNDDAAMSRRIIELLADPDRASDLGAAGKRRIAENFSEQAQLQNTLALYSSLLNN